jgi:hypothetical protein
MQKQYENKYGRTTEWSVKCILTYICEPSGLCSVGDAFNFQKTACNLLAAQLMQSITSIV